jgi:hypothetical protein
MTERFLSDALVKSRGKPGTLFRLCRDISGNSRGRHRR